MRWMLLLLLAGGCAAPATQLEPCPSCEAEARAAKQAEMRAEAQKEAKREERAAERLRSPGLINRASFDLNCPGQEFVVVELSEAARGVRGCGKQAAYVAKNRIIDLWVLDSPVH